ncbi:MAG: Phage portal protein [Chloroflexi bacterium ADurb.Bin180]|nr:MAG: Phage portal protein [Chloroflexi bacterium ADurb.Bin180]
MRIQDRIKAALRAWKVGPGVADTWASTWGKSSDDYQPAEYVDYLATSNAVYVCANLRANLLSSLPVRLYRANSAGDETEVTQGELYELLKTPNPHYTLARLVKITELSLCLWGEAFWCLERGSAGRQLPKEVWWARADKMKVFPDPVNYISGFGYDSGGGDLIRFQPGEVVWLRFANPADEYEGLAPLAAARLAADVASSAMKSNKAIFDNGLQIGGILSPPKDQLFTEDQAKDLERDLTRRFQGTDKAHRVAVLRFQAEWQRPELTPADAQFSEALRFSLEEVARAFSVPLDFIGGQRTYENVDAANKAIWTHCILPEAHFVEDELNRQLVPLFPGVTRLEFDSSQVEALQEDRAELVQQMTALYQMGVPLNNLLDEYMPQLKPSAEGFEWGNDPAHKLNAPPAPIVVPPAPAAEKPAEAAPPSEPPAEPGRTIHKRAVKRIEYGSPEHHRLWSHFVRQASRWEEEVKRVVVALFERQRDSILDKMKARKQLEESELDKWFSVSYWVGESKKAIQAVLKRVVEDGGKDALELLGLDLSFDVTDPRVTAFITGRAQRFASLVTDTTWQLLKDTLNEGMKEGESIPELADRVRELMGDRIESSAETIARTEVIGASNGGTMEAWKQSGVVKGKTWLSALDDRTRGQDPKDEFNHYDCHGETVAIDEPFVGTNEDLMYPGDEAGSAGNVINCRCTMTAVLDIDWPEDEQ